MSPALASDVNETNQLLFPLKLTVFSDAGANAKTLNFYREGISILMHDDINEDGGRQVRLENEDWYNENFSGTGHALASFGGRANKI